MPKIDLSHVPVQSGSLYPEPYASMMAGRSSQRPGDAGGLTQFGANITHLAPGAMSSMRHWHLKGDEFVMVIEGDLTLVDDAGDTMLRPFDCAAFPAGERNGHHIVNKSQSDGKFLVIGPRLNDETAYFSDVDMMVTQINGYQKFTKRDGTLLREGKER